MTNDPHNVTYLAKGAKWFNPFFVMVDKYYQIKDIYLYESNGATFHTGRGWFGSGNNNLESLPIPIPVIRNKPKFDSKAFIIKKGWEKGTDQKTYFCHLYIPAKYFLFEQEECQETDGFTTHKYPLYRCSWNKEVYIIDYEQEIIIEDEAMKQEAFTLVAEKLKLLARLEEIDNRMGAVDPYKRIEEIVKQAAERMNGAKP